MKRKVDLWTVSESSSNIHSLGSTLQRKIQEKQPTFGIQNRFFSRLIRFLAEKSKHHGVKERLCHDSETILIFKWVKEES